MIASSDGKGLLQEHYPLQTGGQEMANYADKNGHVVGFAVTPGYETYRGLGWYGVVEQKLRSASRPVATAPGNTPSFRATPTDPARQPLSSAS